GLQTAAGHGFDTYIGGKPLLKAQKSLPPGKFNDRLLADMIALRLTITASAQGAIPNGFGELVLSDTGSDAVGLTGMMVKEIAHYGDSVMMGSYQGVVHVFPDTGVYGRLDRTIFKINNAFEGPVDTLNPGFAAGLHMKGTRPLVSVPFLIANPSATPDRMT